jgi:hypothetical protein
MARAWWCRYEVISKPHAMAGLRPYLAAHLLARSIPRSKDTGTASRLPSMSPSGARVRRAPGNYFTTPTLLGWCSGTRAYGHRRRTRTRPTPGAIVARDGL